VGLSLLQDAARTAGTATVLFCLACMATGLFGILLTSQRTQPERAIAALRLSRNLALVGGLCGVLGALAAVPYYWLIGAVGEQTALITELLLLGLVAVWAVLAAAVLVRDARRQSR
jgi:hypothetical protein